MAYTRQQLKQDKFAETAKETVSWAVEHRNMLVGAAIVVGVVLAVVLGAWFYYSQRNREGSAELGRALQTYRAPIRPANAPVQPNFLTFASAEERAQAARKLFQQVEDEYRHTHVADVARYFVGVTSIDMGDYETAQKVLKEVADSNDKGLSPLGKYALASVYRTTNRNDEAIKLYQELVAHPSATVPKTTAQLELASLYQEKQPAEAARIYQEIQKDAPQGIAAEIAGSRLATLKSE